MPTFDLSFSEARVRLGEIEVSIGEIELLSITPFATKHNFFNLQ